MTAYSYDEYFVGVSEARRRLTTDWESPSLYYNDQYITDLISLREGKIVGIHCRSREVVEQGIKMRMVVPRGLVIVEGFLVFHDPRATAHYQKKIFIDLPEEEMVKRRIARSLGNDEWDNADYIRNGLLQGHRLYVLPQKDKADLILDGLQPINELTGQAVKFLA